MLPLCHCGPLENSRTYSSAHKKVTKEERLGLKQLSTNPEIVIKKADKGSAVVIMQTTDYLREGYRQLSDRNFYNTLTEDPTLAISNKICAVLTK